MPLVISVQTNIISMVDVISKAFYQLIEAQGHIYASLN